MFIRNILDTIYSKINNKIKEIESITEISPHYAELIVIEGSDMSGKKTQATRLVERLKADGYKAVYFTFPNYSSDSSIHVRQYLNGEFGDNSTCMNSYQASMLFATDRLITYKTELNKMMMENDIVVLDRYIGSNLIHQSAKILMENYNNSFEDTMNKVIEFLSYWWDFEINKLELPEPLITIYLDLPYKYGKKISKNRPSKIDGSQRKDIHEKDSHYMNMCNMAGFISANLFGWNIVNCIEKKNIFITQVRSIQDIGREIYNTIKPILPEIYKFQDNANIKRSDLPEYIIVHDVGKKV